MSYISLPLREINLKRWCIVGLDQNMYCVGEVEGRGSDGFFLEIKVFVLSNNDF